MDQKQKDVAHTSGRELHPDDPRYNARPSHPMHPEDVRRASYGEIHVEQTLAEQELESNRRLSQFSKNHQWDPNLPEYINQEVGEMTEKHDLQREISFEQHLAEDSIYPEVRAAVRNYDEDVPVNTFRSWFLGLLFAALLAGANMLFSMRNPNISISLLVAQVITYPLGLFMALVLPTKRFTTFGYTWSLNPGPFSIKEHTLIVVMANVAYSPAYATDIIMAIKSKEFYNNQSFGYGFEILLMLSTQMIGYGIAGLMRRYLVYPAAMIWPSNLVQTSLFYTLHDHRSSDPTKTNGWRIPRFKFFLIVMVASAIYYFIPGLLMTCLSVFTFVTFIKPNNVIINQVFGGSTGLGIIPLTFDWTTITGFLGSPLIPPWFAIGNALIGVVSFYWILAPIVHYSNSFYAQYLPMSDSSTYTNLGTHYIVKKVLTKDYLLDQKAYSEYSPLFISTTFAISYGLSFAGISSLLVHTILYSRKEIWARFRASRMEDEDCHNKMMAKYKEAPEWWYLTIFLVMTALSFVTILVWPTHMTWWSLLLAVFISLFFALPIGMIQAISNVQIGLNVITEFIIGYLTPGRPIAMMIFKTYGYITMTQGLSFVADLKLGHYMKIPPRSMFAAQMAATVLSCFVQLAVLNTAMEKIPNACNEKQHDKFTCPNGRVFFSASVIWGLLGPGRMFSPGQIYDKLLIFFGIGAVLPVISYVVARLRPNSWFRYINFPLIFAGPGFIPPATPLNYMSWGIVGFVFQSRIRNKFRGWWSEYNYILSAGLDIGLAIGTLFIFFVFTFRGVNGPSWWGNNIADATMDVQHTAIRVQATEKFGPASWH